MAALTTRTAGLHFRQPGSPADQAACAAAECETACVSLRDRTSSDIPVLVDLLRRVHDEDNYPTVWPADPAGWLVSADSLGASVAEFDGDIAGHVSLDRAGSGARTDVWVEATGHPSNALGEVTRLFIDPQHRGVGIGRQLIGRAVDTAHRLGLWPVLDVRQNGRASASRLYAAAGWRFIGTAPHRLSHELVLPFDCWLGPPPPDS